MEAAASNRSEDHNPLDRHEASPVIPGTQAKQSDISGWLPIKRNLNATLEAQSKLRAAIDQLHFNKTLSLRRQSHHRESNDTAESMEASQLISVSAERPRNSIDWASEISAGKQQKIPMPNRRLELSHWSGLDHESNRANWSHRKSAKTSGDQQQTDPLNGLSSSSSSSYRAQANEANPKLSSRSESISLSDRDESSLRALDQSTDPSDAQDDSSNEEEDESTTGASNQPQLSSSTTQPPQVFELSPPSGSAESNGNEDAGELPESAKSKSIDSDVVSLNLSSSVGLMNPSELQMVEKPSLNWRFTSPSWQSEARNRPQKLRNNGNQYDKDESQYLGASSDFQVKPPIIRTIRFIPPPENQQDQSQLEFIDRQKPKFPPINLQEMSDSISGSPQASRASWSAPRVETSDGFSPSTFHQNLNRRPFQASTNFDYLQLHSTPSIQQTSSSEWPPNQPIFAGHQTMSNNSNHKRLQFSPPLNDQTSNFRSVDPPGIREPHIWHSSQQSAANNPRFPSSSNWQGEEDGTRNSLLNRWRESSSILGNQAGWPSTALVFEASPIGSSSTTTSTTSSPKMWISNGHNPTQHRISPHAPNGRPPANSMVRAFAQFPFAHHPVPFAAVDSALNGYTTNGHTLVGIHNHQAKDASELDELAAGHFDPVASSPTSFIYMEPQTNSQVSSLFPFGQSFSFAGDPFGPSMTAFATMPASAFEDPDAGSTSTTSTTSTTIRPMTIQNMGQNQAHTPRANHKTQVISSIIPLADPTALTDAFGWPMGFGSEATKSLIKINHVAPLPSYLVGPLHGRTVAANGPASPLTIRQQIPLSSQHQPVSTRHLNQLKLSPHSSPVKPTSMMYHPESLAFLDSPWIHPNPQASMPFESFAHFPGSPIWQTNYAQNLEEFQANEEKGKLKLANSNQSDNQSKNQSRRRLVGRSRLLSRFLRFNNTNPKNIARRAAPIYLISLEPSKSPLGFGSRSKRQKRGIVDSVTNLVKSPFRKNLKVPNNKGKVDNLIAIESQTNVQYVAPPASMSNSISQISSDQMQQLAKLAMVELPSLASDLNVTVNQPTRQMATSLERNQSRTKTAFIPLIDQHNLMNSPGLSEASVLAQAFRAHSQNQNHLASFDESPLELMNEAETTGNGQDASYTSIRMPLISAPPMSHPSSQFRGSSFLLSPSRLNPLVQAPNRHSSIFYTPLESNASLDPPANEPSKNTNKQVSLKSRDRIKNLLKSSRKPLDKLMRFSRFPSQVNSTNRTVSMTPSSSEIHSIALINGKNPTLSLAQSLNAVVSPSIFQFPESHPSSLENFNKFAIPLQNWYQNQLKSSQTMPMSTNRPPQTFLLPLADHISQSMSPYSLITSNSHPQIHQYSRPASLDHQRILFPSVQLIQRHSSLLSQAQQASNTDQRAINGSTLRSSLPRKESEAHPTNANLRGSQRVDTNDWSLFGRPIAVLQDFHHNLVGSSHVNRPRPIHFFNVKRTSNFGMPPNFIRSNQTIGRFYANKTYGLNYDPSLHSYSRGQRLGQSFMVQPMRPQGGQNKFLSNAHRTRSLSQNQADLFSASASNQRPFEMLPVQTEGLNDRQPEMMQISNLEVGQPTIIKASPSDHLSDLISSSEPADSSRPPDGVDQMGNSMSFIPGLDDQQSTGQLLMQPATIVEPNSFDGLAGTQNRPPKLIKFIPAFNLMANKVRQHLYQTFRLNPLNSMVKRPQSLPLTFNPLTQQHDTFIMQSNGENQNGDLNQFTPLSSQNIQLSPRPNQQDDLHLEAQNSGAEQMMLDPSFSFEAQNSANISSYTKIPRPSLESQINLSRPTSNQEVEQGEYLYIPESLKVSMVRNQSTHEIEDPGIYENTQEVIQQQQQQSHESGAIFTNGTRRPLNEENSVFIRPTGMTKVNQIMTEMNGNMLTSDGSYIREDEQQPQLEELNWPHQKPMESGEQKSRFNKPDGSNYTVHHHHHLVPVGESDRAENQSYASTADGSVMIKHLMRPEQVKNTLEIQRHQVPPSGRQQQVIELKYELERFPIQSRRPNQTTISRARTHNKTRIARPHLIVLSSPGNRSIPIDISSGTTETTRSSDYQVIKADQTTSSQPKLIYAQGKASRPSTTSPQLSEETSDVDYQSIGTSSGESSEDEQQEQANGQKQQIVYDPEGGIRSGGIIYGHQANAGGESSDPEEESPQVNQIVYEEAAPSMDHDATSEDRVQTKLVQVESHIKHVSERRPVLPPRFVSKKTDVKPKDEGPSIYVDQPIVINGRKEKPTARPMPLSEPAKTDKQPMIFVSVKPQKIIRIQNEQSNDSWNKSKTQPMNPIRSRANSTSKNPMASATASSRLSFSVTSSKNSTLTTTTRPQGIKSQEDLVSLTRESLTTSRSPKAKIRWQGVSGSVNSSPTPLSSNSSSRWLTSDRLSSVETNRNEQKQAWIVGGMTHQAYGGPSKQTGQNSSSTPDSSFGWTVSNLTHNSTQLMQPDLTTNPHGSNNASSYSQPSDTIESHESVGPHTWRLNGNQSANNTSNMSSLEPGVFQTFRAINRLSPSDSPSNHRTLSPLLAPSESRTAPTSFRLDSAAANLWSSTSQPAQLVEPTERPAEPPTTPQSSSDSSRHSSKLITRDVDHHRNRSPPIKSNHRDESESFLFHHSADFPSELSRANETSGSKRIEPMENPVDSGWFNERRHSDD